MVLLKHVGVVSGGVKQVTIMLCIADERPLRLGTEMLALYLFTTKYAIFLMSELFC